MEPNKVNDIDPNWIMASTVQYKDPFGTIRPFEDHYIAVYITGRDFIETIRSIKGLQNLDNNYELSGKIVLHPKNLSFDLSLIYGKFSDMIDLSKDRSNDVKRSKLKLIDKNPSYSKISVEYDVSDNSLSFKYDDDCEGYLGHLRSDKINLDKFMELLENKLKDGNSKLQD